MRSFAIIIFSIILLVIGFLYTQGSLNLSFLRPSTAYAVGDLTVNWGVTQGDPIFTFQNFAPGQSESHTVIVSNGASLMRPVGVRGIKTNETGSLSNVLFMTISQNGSDIYGGTTGAKTLAQFFQDSQSENGIFLSNIVHDEQKQFIFTVSFDPNADNEFQGKNVVFDLQIGISIAIPASCQNIQFDGQTIFGTQGNDRNLNGTPKNDLIFGLEGDDRIFGKGGQDCIIGGDGNDRLFGETGNDTIHGGPGEDIEYGGGGKDTIFGNENEDRIWGETGRDILQGGPGDDEIRGGDDNDAIQGNEGDDTIWGESGVDEIHGNENNDWLNGGTGNDSILGETGIDAANGSSGKDSCTAELKRNCEL